MNILSKVEARLQKVQAAPNYGPGSRGGFYKKRGTGPVHLAAPKGEIRKAGRDALKAAFDKAFARCLPKFVKGGGSQAWLKKNLMASLTESLEEFYEGFCPLGDLLRSAASYTPETMLEEWNSGIENLSIQQVKSEGVKLAKNPQQKIKLLQKMGLTGAEFPALCLMIKEQI